jgi:predicted membrane protein
MIFDGLEVASSSTAFQGGRLVCVYGGAQIDLSGATFADEATLRVGCLFGGARILVPEGVRVTTKQVAILGGVEVEVRDDELSDSAPHLQIEALAVFGGVNISREQQP